MCMCVYMCVCARHLADLLEFHLVPCTDLQKVAQEDGNVSELEGPLSIVVADDIFKQPPHPLKEVAIHYRFG